MEIQKYLRLVLRWWWLLVVSALIPMVISYTYTSRQPDFYQAKATIMVGTSLQSPDPELGQMNLSNTLAAAYAELVRQAPVTEAVIERLGLERTPAQLAAQIATGIRPGAYLLEIWVTDTNPEAAALIANALADELMRRSPASGGSDPEQQEFIRSQLEELQSKIGTVSGQIDGLTASLAELTSAAEIQDAQDRLAALEEVKSTYQTTYVNLLDSYSAESPNVLSLFEAAAVPQWPIPSKAKLVVAVAGAAGVGLAVMVIFLMEYLDTSLQWEGSGMQSVLELPVLGAIPQVSRKWASLTSSPAGPVAESIRAIRANIFLLCPDRPFRTLLLTSPGPSEGKGLVLANLALVLASTGSRVIVVDADMRRPSLHELFDQPNATGLADFLRDYQTNGGRSLSVPLQKTRFHNLLLLSAGCPPTDSAALLISPGFPALLELLKDQGDVILIGGPPVLGPPDAAIVATLAEGTILVVSAGVTKREAIQRAGDLLLSRQGVNLLGLTVNRAKFAGSQHDYSRDGRSEGKEQKRKADNRAWLTLSEAASDLGISKTMVQRWCKTGRLTARRSGLHRLVKRDDVERLVHVQMISGASGDDRAV